MSGVTRDDLDEWINAIDTLHDSVSTSGGGHAASEAAANLWSGFGYQDPPHDVQIMLCRAIEIGYLIAQRDARAEMLDLD